MDNHPLKYHIDLIENNHLNILNGEFYNFENFMSFFDPTLFDENEIFWDSDNKAYIQRNLKSKDVIYTYTFDNHLGSLLDDYNRAFKEIVRMYLLENSEKCKEYAGQLKLEIANLMKISSQNHKAFLPIILKKLKVLDTFLNDLIGGNSVRAKFEQQTNIKLKWLGKISTLTTLFFDLSNDRNNLKTQFLEYQRKSLTDFITNSFVDANGDSFDRDTIYRYLNSNPLDDKKAMKRLDFREDLQQKFLEEEPIPLKKIKRPVSGKQMNIPKSFREALDKSSK